eukprot:TRINITY_DN994_c0_g1_i2.p2 TRINITY_DN994_c0_g1~~TRINITY_DN994_c0_g1_i2.p2  ORF type:complete len:235 (-),score=21.28 TRINITY_DN994_c0_g1_i2:316-1020(-)
MESRILHFCTTTRDGSANWMDHERNVLFHLNPRPSEGQIVMNTLTNGAWGSEERIALPLGSGPLHMSVQQTSVGFIVRLDGLSDGYVYRHRSTRPVASMVLGRQWSLVPPRNREATTWALDTGEGRHGAADWRTDLVRGDILFHFNPRPSEGQIVMNTLIDGAWGSEERIALPPGKLRPTICATHHGFEIHLHGVCVHLFRHRLPFARLACVQLPIDWVLAALSPAACADRGER